MQTSTVTLTAPITPTIVDHSEIVDGDRTEMRSTVELVGANGSMHRVKGYILKADRADAYDTTMIPNTDRYLSKSDAESTDSDVRVTIISGQKGMVKGNIRHDEVEVTSFGPEGVFKSPAKLMEKNLIDRYAGLTPQETVTKAFADSYTRTAK